MSRELTKKEKGFVRDIVNGKTQVQAGLDNYDTTDYMTASAIASENLNKPKIQKAIKSIADEIPNSLLKKVHLEGLKASDISYDIEGNIIREKPDFATRHKYLDTAYKIKKLYPKEGGTIIPVQVNVSTDRDKYEV